MATTHRIIKNTFFLYFRLFITLVVSLWTTRIVLEALGIDNFGIYNVVGGAVALLGFLNASLSTSSQRFLSYAEGQGETRRQCVVFNSCIILHFGISIILGLIILLAGFIFFNGLLNIPENRIFAAKIVYLTMGLSAMISVITVPYEATVNAHENMQYYAFIGILEVILKLAIAFLILAITVDKLIIYGILMALVHLITFIIIAIYCHHTYSECRLRFKSDFDIKTIRHMGSFAGWNLLTSATSMTTQYGLNIIINHFFGVVINAAQGIASQVSGVLSNLSTNALKAINPIIVKSESQNQREKMLYLSTTGCRISFFIFGLLAIPLMLNMNLILHIWLTEVPKWTIIFCELALIRILIEQLTFGLTTSIMAKGEIRWFNIWRSISNILPLIICPILFSNNLPPYWMYVIWIICWSCLGGIITVFYCQSLLNLSISKFIRSNIIPSICIWICPFIMGLIIKNLTNTTLLSIEAGITSICILLYLILAWCILLTKEERFMILKLAKIK